MLKAIKFVVALNLFAAVNTVLTVTLRFPMELIALSFASFILVTIIAAINVAVKGDY